MAISTDLWRQYGDLSRSDVPEDVWCWAAHCTLDWYGVSILGSAEPVSVLLREEYADDSGPASVIGTTMRADAATAALLNGAATHAIDFDDSNKAGGGHHPAAPVIPVAYAVAQSRHATGREFLAAVVAGYEFAYAIGEALGGEIFRKGWHPTLALGVFGSLAAAGSLLRLDETEFGNAFGIAASQSGGLQANFGTMTKPLHAGLAAQAGITAARLARRGVTANPAALETMAGLAELMGDGSIHWDLLDAARHEWVIRRNIFKYHASCLGTHAPIEAALAAAGAGVPVGDIDRVVVLVNPLSTRICRFDYPSTGLEAKFCIRATTAMALLGDRLGDPGTFSDERIRRQDFVEMMAKISLVADEAMPRQNAVVEIDMRDGRRLRGHHDSSIPATDIDAQESRLRHKFLTNTEPVLGGDARRFADRLLSVVAAADVADLTPAS